MSSTESNYIYRPPKFKKNTLSDRLKCPLCKEVLNFPKQSSCGHRFCSECIENYLRLRNNNPAMCPVPECDTQLYHDEIYSDHGMKREINELVVFCRYKDDGCDIELKLKNLEKHIVEQCRFLIIDCLNKSLGCQVRVKRCELDKHIKIECVYRLIECSNCHQSLVYAELKNHDDICPKFLIVCQNKCSKTKIARDSLDQHLLSCPNQKQNCSYFQYGCQFTGFGPDIKKHESDVKSMAVHLDWLKVGLARTELGCTEAKRKIAELQNHKTITDTKLREIDKNTRGAQNSNTELENKLKDLHKTLASLNDKYLKMEKQMEKIDDEKQVEEMQRILQSIEIKTKNLEEKLMKIERKGISTQINDNRRDEINFIHPLELEQLGVQCQQFDRQLGMHDIRLAEQDLRFQILETASHDGVLIWKIKDYTRRKREAASGSTLSLYSQPFYTSRYGYKMCARVYLNGDGMGKGSHMSLFFVVMKGEYDALLQWPFKQKVTLMLFDQETGRRHMSDTFRPDPNSSSFRKPSSDMNIASGCPLFVSHSILESPTYIKSDTLFIKVIVDTSDLYGP